MTIGYCPGPHWQLRDAIAAGETTSLAATQVYLDAIAAEDGEIGAYNEVFTDDALELDLALDPISDQHGYGADFYSQDILDDMRAAGRRQHKLNESRRIRAPSSHYFDHPLFGVIARIQKIVVEPPADENAG